MAAPVLSSFVLALIIRFLLLNTSIPSWLADSPEITTPINAWSRVEEGLSLVKLNVSPYSGDIFHETPLLLHFIELFTRIFPEKHHYLFGVLDIIIGVVLVLLSNEFIIHSLIEEHEEKHLYHKNSAEIQLNQVNLSWIQVYIVAVHFFNPFTLTVYLTQSTTAFVNLFILLTFYFTIKGRRLWATLFLALSAYQSFYPIMLLVPMALHFYQLSGSKHRLLSTPALLSYFVTSATVFLWLGALLYVSFLLTGSLQFISATYGYILSVPDLTPNIGLFWYFFTEMFEHFRTFFLFVFQINVFIYTVPLAIKLRDHPIFFLYIQMCLMCVLKSYPSYGDVGLYLSLLPLWAHLFPHMRNGLLICVLYLTCTTIAPIFWYLWITAGSANANFYFAITLVFSAAQIFLITDLIYSFLRRKFQLFNGTDIRLSDGRKALLTLQ